MPEERNRLAKSPEEIARAYSSPPWWYDLRGFLILTFAYRGTIAEQLQFFGPNIGLHHLEVAVGSGTLLDLILKWRKTKGFPEARIKAIDYAESMLAGAINRFKGRPYIELYHADVASLPFQTEQFDSANIANSIHSFPDAERGLSEVFRVLKPGGTFAANVLLYPKGSQPFRYIAEQINRWGIRKGILVSPYNVADIQRQILKAGFQILEERESGNGYSVLACKPEFGPVR